MSLSLAEALDQVDLEAGQVYRCQVKGCWIELRVLVPSKNPKPSPFDESDIMLDPWVEFPRPTSTIRVRAKAGSLPLPDAPEIPPDSESP